MSGTNDLQITYKSDNQLDSNIGPDDKRRLIVDVRGELIVGYNIDTSLWDDGMHCHAARDRSLKLTRSRTVE